MVLSLISFVIMVESEYTAIISVSSISTIPFSSLVSYMCDEICCHPKYSFQSDPSPISPKIACNLRPHLLQGKQGLFLEPEVSISNPLPVKASDNLMNRFVSVPKR